MMKKRGFTLAEVLITLTIIGVVATMTLPALMTNTAEQQARTGLKKGINTLTEAAQMNLATEGWDFATAITANGAGIVANADLNQMNFESLIGNRTSVDYSKGIALPPQMVTELAGDLRAVYLKDGSAIYYDPATAIAERGEQGAGSNVSAWSVVLWSHRLRYRPRVFLSQPTVRETSICLSSCARSLCLTMPFRRSLPCPSFRVRDVVTLSSKPHRALTLTLCLLSLSALMPNGL